MNNPSKDKKKYEAPHLTVVSFKTEQGYAASGLRSLALSGDQPDYGDESVEDRQNGGNWGGTDGWF